MSKSPVSRPAAVVAVVMRGEKTLVVRRASGMHYAGYFGPLSGMLEPGESESAAVVREVREEVGLAVTPVRRVWECLTEDGKCDLYWWLAEASEGDVVLDTKEVSEARWIMPTDFGALETTFADDRKFYSEVFPHLPEVS
ncbi:MAG: NUDIX domain-containing protein [Actinobacteria bacterium]|nr:NUDIX domain-containing protein [Actinomycetota bacterium]